MIGIPVPNMAATQMDQMMAHGTAVTAFDASSEICTAESNEPITQITVSKQLTSLINKMRTYRPDWSHEAQNECKAIWPVIHYGKPTTNE